MGALQCVLCRRAGGLVRMAASRPAAGARRARPLCEYRSVPPSLDAMMLLAVLSLFQAAHGSAQRRTAVTATFEPPVVVHKSYDGQHAWFASLTDPQNPQHDLLLSMSLGGDGTPCPPPNRTQNCSMTLLSSDGGKSWDPFQDWSRFSPNEVLPLQNGSFLTLPYRLTVD